MNIIILSKILLTSLIMISTPLVGVEPVKTPSSAIIVPQQSALYSSLEEMASNRNHRIIVFSGIPGMGKSLILQQFALIAHHSGRKIHLLQWDVSRGPFEQGVIAERYPELNGTTHPAVRLGVGKWVRQGILDWFTNNPGEDHLLLVETPLFGNRLTELAMKIDDEIEALLAGPQTKFVLPVPTVELRENIIYPARTETYNNPRHEREYGDAPPEALDGAWVYLYELIYSQSDLNESDIQTPSYSPDVYKDIYQNHLLMGRNVVFLDIAEALPVESSVYEIPEGVIVSELQATYEQSVEIIEALAQQYQPEEFEEITSHWYENLLNSWRVE